MVIVQIKIVKDGYTKKLDGFVTRVRLSQNMVFGKIQEEINIGFLKELHKFHDYNF